MRRMNMTEMQDMQDRVDEYIGQFKEGYFPPLVQLARLTEEVGELSREINHVYGQKRKRLVRLTNQWKRKLPMSSLSLSVYPIHLILIYQKPLS